MGFTASVLRSSESLYRLRSYFIESPIIFFYQISVFKIGHAASILEQNFIILKSLKVLMRERLACFNVLRFNDESKWCLNVMMSVSTSIHSNNWSTQTFLLYISSTLID